MEMDNSINNDRPLAAKISTVNVQDVSGVRKFVDSCNPLTLHTAVTYALMFDLSPDLCFVAESNGEIVGFASSIIGTKDRDALYCWQVGVHPDHRGSGLAERLIDSRIEAGRSAGCTKVQVGIEPSNKVSLGLWQKVAKKLGKELQEVRKVSFNDELSGGEEYDVVWEMDI
jgi:L-2,4-diaminobutyric acid acetyltransferase